MPRVAKPSIDSAEAAMRGLRVLVTGHTGFCGGWLAIWLRSIGCDVAGIALAPEAELSLFELAEVERGIRHKLLDIREADATARCVTALAPDVIFHLAAQPLVRRSYRAPIETFATNVLGTANVLEAARQSGCRAVLVVTTDKVYRNDNSGAAFRETDQLGGHDPYSASKACAELVAESMRVSFPAGPAIATARGGNIIGGGDWSEDRLIPDCVRAVQSGRRITLRNPQAVRPWQHVLALCDGYIRLAAALLEEPERAARAWNFGPAASDAIPVAEIVQLFGQRWRPIGVDIEPADLHEAAVLTLDSTLARDELSWRTPWDLKAAVSATVDWYREVIDNGRDARAVCEQQIDSYRTASVELVSGRDG